MARYIDMDNEYNNWVNLFYSNIFKEEFDSAESLKWMKSKIYKVPTSLFQYTQVKYAYNIIIKDLMFINRFDKLNDPFEGAFLHDKELYEKEGKKIEVDEDYKKLHRVACFTENNNNAPMWAFYGDNHQGICIEYNFHDNTNFRDFCYPVKYVTRTNNTNLTKQFLKNKDPVNGLALELFVKKSYNWSYEKEWRLIFKDKYDYEHIEFEMKNDKRYIKFLKPKAVYMGINISLEDEEYIKDLCNYRNIDIYKMTRDSTDYNLIPEKIL